MKPFPACAAAAVTPAPGAAKPIAPGPAPAPERDASLRGAAPPAGGNHRPVDAGASVARPEESTP